MSKPETTDAQRQLKHQRWLLVDALTYAMGVAARLQEATEGTPDTLLFDAARAAIGQLRDDHPAMKALTIASVRHMRWFG